ncbi:MAG: excinuclease ABC subunit C [Opitutus sp.]|nr:excinuclease ABC subunit C [Opitutus sp.]
MPEARYTDAIREKLRLLPERPGVYLMKDRLGRIIYVGKAKSLKKRVASYFQPGRTRQLRHQPKIRTLIEMIADFETIEVKSEPEALLLEGKLIKQWRPKYNTDFTDDKRFLLVRINLEDEMPRFALTRFRKEDRSRYFGPFAHSGLLRRTLASMRKQFGVLLGDAFPVKLPDGRYKLYEDVRAELYGWPNEVTVADYRARVEQACDFLDGKSREWLSELKAEMRERAAKQEFEKAAELRDVVQALERTLSRTRKFTRDLTRLRPNEEALRALGEALHLPGPPVHMECFDISHISGTFVVASMVHFTDGVPDKANYRRFSIKSFIGNDDFRAMEEVVTRRYKRLLEEQKQFPDLVVIDGGRGQIAAALKAFLAIEAPPPPMIGLAKKHETIIFPDARAPLNLPLSHPSLNILQRLRDEAHRFANTYNADLRSRKIRESVLDDFPGLGDVRRVALLAHFGSIEKLRSATAEQIAEVPGFGRKFATELQAFLTGQRESPSSDETSEAAASE